VPVYHIFILVFVEYAEFQKIHLPRILYRHAVSLVVFTMKYANEAKRFLRNAVCAVSAFCYSIIPFLRKNYKRKGEIHTFILHYSQIAVPFLLQAFSPQNIVVSNRRTRRTPWDCANRTRQKACPLRFRRKKTPPTVTVGGDNIGITGWG